MSTPEQKPCIPFPKIGDFSGFAHAYKLLLKHKEVAPGPIKLIGTVKLHGSHADIVVHWDGTIVLQSRNKVITPASDNHECAKTLAPLSAQILCLRNQFVDRFERLNGNGSVGSEVPVIIAGEWVGHKVQPLVALSQLPNRVFVIVGCKISNIWVPLEKYHDLSNESAGIYSISRSGFKTITITISHNKSHLEAAKKIIMDSTLKVEQECPWTKTVFNISGIGEGIVWKPDFPLGADPKFWFKSKGKIHLNTNTEGLATAKEVMNVNPEVLARVFAEKAVTENRLNQGLNVMREMGYRREETESRFLEWVHGDVVVEERLLLKEMKIDSELLKTAIYARGRTWYREHLGRLWLRR